jgi:hypothetical protein
MPRARQRRSPWQTSTRSRPKAITAPAGSDSRGAHFSLAPIAFTCRIGDEVTAFVQEHSQGKRRPTRLLLVQSRRLMLDF